MKSVLFSYILHYPFLFAFRWGYRRISQRICQRHGKIARKHFIYKVTLAVSDTGRISVKTFDLLFDGNRRYFEYGCLYTKINQAAFYIG